MNKKTKIIALLFILISFLGLSAFALSAWFLFPEGNGKTHTVLGATSVNGTDNAYDQFIQKEITDNTQTGKQTTDNSIGQIVVEQNTNTNVVIESVNLVRHVINVVLGTDKPYYKPDDTVIIKSNGLYPNTNYKLGIFSKNEPPYSLIVPINSNSNGEIEYMFEQDGIYRPNYLIALKNSTDNSVIISGFNDKYFQINPNNETIQSSDNTYPTTSVQNYYDFTKDGKGVFTFHCEDTFGKCKTTYFTTDGNEPDENSLSIDWTSVNPDNVLNIDNVGTYQIKYFSIDFKGNKEPVKETAIATKEKIISLFNDGFLESTNVNDSEYTNSLTTKVDLLIQVPADNLDNYIQIPSGTPITKSDNTEFKVSDLESKTPALNSLSGLGKKEIPKGALQWGLKGSTLEFEPITISIYVGQELNGNILYVKRSPTGNGNWTNEGILYPGTCTVSIGYCTFKATKASTYVTFSQSILPAPTDTPISTPTLPPTNTPSVTPIYETFIPVGTSIINRIIASETMVKINIKTSGGAHTKYVISFGKDSNANQFTREFNYSYIPGSSSTTVEIGNLTADTEYYFKVKTINGTQESDWSNILKIKTPAKQNEITLTPSDINISTLPQTGQTDNQEYFMTDSMKIIIISLCTCPILLIVTYILIWKKRKGKSSRSRS